MSHDDTTQNGSILYKPNTGVVLASANQYPSGLVVEEYMRERPAKYHFIVCAERNLIYQSAKKGISPTGMIMYCPFIACTECAKAIVQSGVKHLIGHENLMSIVPDRWIDRIQDGIHILTSGGVKVELWKGSAFAPDENITIKFNGEDFSP